MSTGTLRRLVRHHTGATVVFVAVLLVVLLGITALAIDVGYLRVVRGELQNAADSGALAGAQVLYNDAGTSVNADAIQVADQWVVQNPSEKVPATAETIEIGHWRFADKTFHAIDPPYPAPPNLWDVTTEQLDDNLQFVNAVRVITRRKQDAAGQVPENFFARVIGSLRTEVKAIAVAYIGFAGTLEPEKAKQPIAICQESIRDENGNYTCGVGRMINSGGNVGHNTGGWTNFSQPCETANVSSVRPLVCGEGNPVPLFLGQGMGSVGGELQTVADDLAACWMTTSGINRDAATGDRWPDMPWTLTLPVIECPDNNVSPCSTVVGAVTLNVIWITRNDKNQMAEVPRWMGDWPGAAPTGSVPLTQDVPPRCNGSGLECWNSFVDYFNLEDILNNSPAIYEDKTIYFLPDCSPHVPTGRSGGQNFGILARIPVLVR
jgi:hypothetical protein